MRAWAVLLLLAALACGDDGAVDADDPPRQTRASADSVQAPLYSEAQVLGILANAFAADSAAAVRARQAWEAASVNRYAGMLLDDHAAMRRQLRILAEALGTDTAGSGLARQFRRAGEVRAMQLAGRRGRDLDTAFLAYEVTAHEALLKAMDGLLLPSARRPELQETLILVRNAVQAHLRRAQELHASLQSQRAPASDGAPATTTPEAAPPPPTTPPPSPPSRDTAPRIDTVPRTPPPLPDTVEMGRDTTATVSR